MQNAPGRFCAVIGIGWVLLGLAAWAYAHTKGIPAAVAVPVAAAFLIELPFYLWPAFRTPREWLAAQPKWRAALLLTLASALPWAALSLSLAAADPRKLAMLLLAAGAVSFWYVFLPVRPWSDARFCC